MRAQALLLGMVFGVICLAGSAPAGADVNYPDFNSVAGLNLVGVAAQYGDRLRVTPVTDREGGAAWYKTKQQVDAGFVTTFDFQFTGLGWEHSGWQDIGGDGLTFAVQNSSDAAIGASGAAIGYGSDPNNGIPNSLVVELDTYPNNWGPAYLDNGDPDNNHISVQTNGLGPNNAAIEYSLGYTTGGIPNMSDEEVHSVKIEYYPGTMDVYLDDMINPALSVSVDLDSLLGLDDGKAWVGFTAGVGASWENHDILTWSFSEVPEPGTLALLGIASACVALRRRRRGGAGSLTGGPSLRQRTAASLDPR